MISKKQKKELTKHSDLEQIETLREAHSRIIKQIENRIIGQHHIIDELLIAMFSQGHCLIIGVPGLAKTLLISTLSRVLDLKFNRIQFTPDLMPSDITGTEVLEENMTTGKKVFRFVKGPIFGNIILADEINRTPPKTQSALLQAMQEYEVSAGGSTFQLDRPFFVLATQNPIEQEGTYPLPEAQLDRFMFNLWIDYPLQNEEIEIVRSTTGDYEPQIEVVMDSKTILNLHKLVRRVPVAELVVEYAVNLVRKTRPDYPDAPKYIKDWVSWGAGPRASQYLILGAKSRCILNGRTTPDIDDVRAVAKPVLRHRIVSNFNAEAEGIDTVDIIEKLLANEKE
jgi:MoxR-like ATPase